MKREGRQHGVVRTCVILPSSSLSSDKSPELEPAPMINKKLGSSQPTAGLYKKVCTKPTNHSKSNGKCGKIKCWGCHHVHPIFKSKEKIKGSQKEKSTDVALNYKLLAWRVADGGGPGFKKLKLNGYSASKILDDLACDSALDCSLFDSDDGEGHDSGGGGDSGCENYEGYDPHGDAGYGLSGRNLLLMGGYVSELFSGTVGEVGDGIEEIDGGDDDDNVVVRDGDVDDIGGDDMMGFIDIAFVWEPIDVAGEEGWSIVGV